MSFSIPLGRRVRDRITKFEGIVTGRAEYLTGCRQYAVQGVASEGREAPSGWFDESRLEVQRDLGLSDSEIALISGAGKEAAPPGGPQRDAPPIR